MANTLAKQVLVNGSRNYVIKLTISGDGSGEETGTLINATTGDCGTACKLMRVQANLTGFTAKLLWDATTDVFAHQIPTDQNVDQKFHQYGGLINNAGTGVTGDILLTTVGLGSGDSGEIILYIKKK